MINRTVLIGRLTKDPDLRVTSSGISVATFTLAVDRKFGSDKNGADFISCVAWRKAGELISQYTHKGRPLAIDGRLQTRTYDDKDGKRVYITEVIVDNFTLLGSKSDNPSQGPAPATTNQPPVSTQTSTNTQDPFADVGNALDISADDLPF